MTHPSAAAHANRRRWQAFAVATSVSALTILDLSKVNVGIPSIERALGAGPTDIQLIVAGYALALGLVLVPAGRLGDLFSRRTMFIAGLITFVTASMLCASAPSVHFLVLFRIIQGVAAGIQTPQVIGMIQELFQGEERGRAFGVFGATIGLSTALGPTVGGLLIGVGGEPDGWRLLFWMNVPLGVAALIGAWFVLPRTPSNRVGPVYLDPVGVLLLGVTVFSLMLPFVLTTGSADDSPARWGWLALAAAAALCFVLWERRYAARGRTPLINFLLFRIPSYRNGILVGGAYFAGMPAAFLLSTLYLQTGLGLAPVAAGLVSISFALCSAGTAWWSGRLVSRWGRPLVVLGLLIVVVGFMGVLVAGYYAPREYAPWLMAAALAVAGFGAGGVLAPNQTLTLAEIPVTDGGLAGSIGQLVQRVSTAIGTAAASSLFFATIYRETVGSAGADDTGVYRDAFLHGFMVVIGFFILACVVALLDMRGRRKRAAAMAL
ncbi:MFS transporter [Klugiella xanthotipulae]|uniref:EmrB/QacA subfamily drug resistance transporter n=1 Tax=Klugiella xanthotipulae TaxID=244735 RepID=A0A543I4G7_9MICO|nr:MFS transporter [Klugiella xanthotipulae]TQM65475.1 EmrB/QacA subfamily drug resistance transporter [Klugiella xanthotipulae]